MSGEEAAPAATDTPRHLPELDGLRAIAILLVIPHNVFVFESTGGWLAPFAWLANAGWIGVQLFFVLSGFLITRNLLDSRGAPNYYSAFFGRRILRIFPLYFLVLAAFLLVLPEFVDLSANVRSSYANQKWLWLFLSNWAQPFGKEVYWFPHFWSLAVEEQFYLLWPLIIAVTPTRRLIPVCLTLVIAALVLRVVMLEAGATPEMVYMFTVCRMDALAIGALAAVLAGIPGFMRIVRERATLLLAAAFIVFGVGALFTHSYTAFDSGTLTMGHTLLAVSMTTVLLAVIAGSPSLAPNWLSAALRVAALRSVGKFSYAMYVFHIPLSILVGAPLLPALRRLGSGYPVWYAIWIAACSYLAAMASYHLLEKHFLRAKRYFVPAKTAAARA
jgi:peptidoglycan/LPS O-acetylase OafA/YrhL